MKKTPYKMKGYTYPGEAPLKAEGENTQTAMSKEKTDSAFDNFEDATDLLKDQGFYVKGPAGLASSPVTKKSPAREDVGGQIVKGIDWEEITQSAVEASVEGVVKGGIQLGAGAIANSGKKKDNKGMDQSGFSGMKFGR